MPMQLEVLIGIPICVATLVDCTQVGSVHVTYKCGPIQSSLWVVESSLTTLVFTLCVLDMFFSTVLLRFAWHREECLYTFRIGMQSWNKTNWFGGGWSFAERPNNVAAYIRNRDFLSLGSSRFAFLSSSLTYVPVELRYEGMDVLLCFHVIIPSFLEQTKSRDRQSRNYLHGCSYIFASGRI